MSHKHSPVYTLHKDGTFEFLAHLIQRLTRWVYSIPMVRRLSVVVVRHPQFQTWISLKPVGQSWSDFMYSITGVGERLLKVLEQISSKLWFPWQQKALLIYNGENDVSTFSRLFLISDEFEFRPYRTTDYGVSCPWASKKFPIDL